MNYKVKGIINEVSEIKTLESGAKVLDYILEHTSENNWVTPFKINLYKSAEYSEHVDNFVKYNKVGDEVEVEFIIRGSEYNGKIYNSLSHWKINKVSSEQPQQEEQEEALIF